jgi:hypothetical protein
MTNRKFYRTLITVEVLSEDPYQFESLSELAYDVDEGECSGKTTIEKTEEIDGETMALLLMAQGSDPEFFRIDDEGNDTDDQ